MADYEFKSTRVSNTITLSSPTYQEHKNINIIFGELDCWNHHKDSKTNPKEMSFNKFKNPANKTLLEETQKL